MQHLPDSALGILLLPSIGIPRWGMTEWLVVAWIRSFGGHTTGGGCPRRYLSFSSVHLWAEYPPSGEYRANYIFLVSLSPRMKVALFPSHKIDTYTYE